MLLQATNAAELMTPNPHSIHEKATLKEAIAFLTDRGFSAAPVIDDAGRPIGVLSRADILVHDREEARRAFPEFYHATDLHTEQGERLGKGFQVEAVDRTRVRDVMTPVVFSVPPNTPSAKVVEHMLGLKVHRLFVVDEFGVLVGVISVIDIIRQLQPE
jgi:CBS domain-containing protein